MVNISVQIIIFFIQILILKINIYIYINDKNDKCRYTSESVCVPASKNNSNGIQDIKFIRKKF